MLELFLLLCCGKENIATSNQKNARLFTLAAEILKENIKLNISVNELADRLDISLSNLKRVFISLAGVGTHEYYNFLKIAKAKELLKQGKSVTETAELTGFANQAYFSAAFKRVTGKTPKEYSLIKPKNDKPIAKKTNNKKGDMPSYLL
jgi:AraC-like DNA-binding protein